MDVAHQQPIGENWGQILRPTERAPDRLSRLYQPCRHLDDRWRDCGPPRINGDLYQVHDLPTKRISGMRARTTCYGSSPQPLSTVGQPLPSAVRDGYQRPDHHHSGGHASALRQAAPSWRCRRSRIASGPSLHCSRRKLRYETKGSCRRRPPTRLCLEASSGGGGAGDDLGLVGVGGG